MPLVQVRSLDHMKYILHYIQARNDNETNNYVVASIFRLLQERLQQMQGDVALFLQSLQYGETEIAMVEFDEFSRVLKPLIPLDSDERLQELLDAIPDDTEYGTCIGCGIQTALEVRNMCRGSGGL